MSVVSYSRAISIPGVPMVAKSDLEPCLFTLETSYSYY